VPDPSSPFTELRFLPGIGPARAETLGKIGLATAWDVLHAVPRLLGPPPALCESGPLPTGSTVRVRARVIQARPVFGRGRNHGMGVEATLERADGYAVKARFFNAGYLRRHLMPGEWFLWEGATDAEQAGVLMHPSFVHLAQGLATPLPVEDACRVAYRLPEGIGERTMRALVDHCLDAILPQIADPAAELADGDYQALLRGLHRPVDADAHAKARRALAWRELLALAWRLQARKAQHATAHGRAWRWDDETHRRALARLPFTLTDGQHQAVTDLRLDLQQSAPMYRLLHGDVGSGKTAVALLASLAVIADGAQAIWFAPTAVLARQHAQFVERCMTGTRVRIGVLTGGTKNRTELLADLVEGRLHLLIGTHALLEDDLVPRCLGLVVIDEQHKFGVEQRAALITRAERRQGWRPDLLLMTATPIPRTLALTAFGDLAVARIAGRPPGRARVDTECARITTLGQLDAPLRDALAAQGQAYVICARRDESDTGEIADATSVHRHCAAVFGTDAVGLLTGAMNETDKLAAMERFAAGHTRVLVSTTVVEVGLDVPGATVVIVLDAERFGLAQLHQLRGRVGRGDRPGRCLLLHRDPDASERLAVLVRHDDGLAIADADLRERGPGELLGTAQHGAAALKIADLPDDLDLLQNAHATAAIRIRAGETCPALLNRLLITGAADVLAGG
jgi:ATP-dependent DNA helicase RecG